MLLRSGFVVTVDERRKDLAIVRSKRKRSSSEAEAADGGQKSRVTNQAICVQPVLGTEDQTFYPSPLAWCYPQTYSRRRRQSTAGSLPGPPALQPTADDDRAPSTSLLTADGHQAPSASQLIAGVDQAPSASQLTADDDRAPSPSYLQKAVDKTSEKDGATAGSTHSPSASQLTADDDREPPPPYMKAVYEGFKNDDATKVEFITVFAGYLAKGNDTVHLDHLGVSTKVRHLLKGYRGFIPGFNTYLPRGYEILLSPRDKQQKIIGALNYMKKIKTRFQSDKNVYNSFMNLELMYRRGTISQTELCHEIVNLFNQHIDLVEEFTYFFPDSFESVSSVTPTRLMAERDIPSEEWTSYCTWRGELQQHDSGSSVTVLRPMANQDLRSQERTNCKSQDEQQQFDLGASIKPPRPDKELRAEEGKNGKSPDEQQLSERLFPSILQAMGMHPSGKDSVALSEREACLPNLSEPPEDVAEGKSITDKIRCRD